MDFYISNLPYLGYALSKMEQVPKDIGVEIFVEYGNTYYWEHMLPPLLKGRSLPLSVHGQFLHLNLCDPDLDFDRAWEAYLQTFDLCNRFGAKHCVCHPHGDMLHDKSKLDYGRKLGVERIVKLSRKASSEGITLLVENMPQKDCIMDQAAFLNHLAPVEELRFLIDTGHANLLNWDIPLALSLLGKRIEAYHINDNMGIGDDHLKAGEGSFDWKTFFDCYVRYTPSAVLVCEYLKGPMDEILKSIESIKSQIALCETKI